VYDSLLAAPEPPPETASAIVAGAEAAAAHAAAEDWSLAITPLRRAHASLRTPASESTRGLPNPAARTADATGAPASLPKSRIVEVSTRRRGFRLATNRGSST